VVVLVVAVEHLLLAAQEHLEMWAARVVMEQLLLLADHP
jgi:hypothetical protein